MRTGFSILLIIHGLIHLLGLIKAFNIASVQQIRHPVSRPRGYFWGLTSVLFILAAVLCLLKNDIWWIVAAFAVISSQLLISQNWSDARAGTIPNIIIILGIVYGLANWSFQHTSISDKNEQVIADAKTGELLVIPETLPDPVRQWLTYTNVSGTITPSVTELTQNGRMKLRQSGDWIPFTANQVFSLNPPGFLWNADVGNSLMNFRGRDTFIEGRGKMLIKAFGIYPLVNESGDKMNQGSAIRYLSEIIWFPWAAVSDYIVWEDIDDHRAKASFHWSEAGGFGTFTFDEMGRPVRFEAKRYFQRDHGASLENWIIEIDPQSFEVYDGILIPTRASVSWELESGVWNWLELEITNVVYSKSSENLN